jgi:hypothetical protein
LLLRGRGLRAVLWVRGAVERSPERLLQGVERVLRLDPGKRVAEVTVEGK